MAIFALSDTHLSTQTDKPMNIFGSRWSDWDKKIVSRWLATVTEEDTVVIPGDISWGISLEDACEDLKLIDALPGKKLISHGNHDYWWSTVSKMTKFMEEQNIKTIDLLYNNAFTVEDKIICGSRGWYTDERTAQGAKIKADYAKIVNRECVRLELSLKQAAKLKAEVQKPLELAAFFHFPPVFDKYVCRPLVDLLHAYGVTDCYFGHIHGQYDIPPSAEFEGIRFSMISADYLDFVPLRIN
ncbi:MAG: metallophosphoesterase [Clostridia bacterium]|nr:metallophosphoesterase [Clostridia bacterium]